MFIDDLGRICAIDSQSSNPLLTTVLLSASEKTVMQLDVRDSKGACMVHVPNPSCYSFSIA
jgi:hypothetical protein